MWRNIYKCYKRVKSICFRVYRWRCIVWVGRSAELIANRVLVGQHYRLSFLTLHTFFSAINKPFIDILDSYRHVKYMDRLIQVSHLVFIWKETFPLLFHDWISLMFTNWNLLFASHLCENVWFCIDLYFEIHSKLIKLQ